MPIRALRGVAALLVMAAIALVAATPGQAGSGKCSSSGQAVIKQMQQVIYFVPSKNEYRGCYAKTGKVTRLITRGYTTNGVVAHGTHATVLETKDEQTAEPGKSDVLVSLWNVKKGKKFRDAEIVADLEGSFDMVDDVLGDPVTAIVYREDGTQVLDVIYDKGTKRLSKAAVKTRSVTVSGRTIKWTEGGKKRSKRV
jgi:hypothetical protein